VVQPIDLNALIHEMTHLLRVSIPKDVALRYNLAPDLPLIQADATQIRQVLMNLVVNAAEAIGTRHGTVMITTSTQWADQDYLTSTYLAPELPFGQYIYFEISDTGSGMDAETTGKIFDPFFTTKFTGRGLGLAAVLGIVRGHQGALKVYSEPGRGTTFKILLPASAATPAQQQPESGQEQAWHGTGTVLVIDDEVSIRDIAKRMLERLGFGVLLAGDGIAGLELFQEQHTSIACVLLDMTMPRMNGEETFRRLRQIAPNVRVVLMSGYNEQDATSHFAGKGLAGFLAKPFSPGDLRDRLRQVIGPVD
jgi:CheY-like chemotaxis protein